MAKLKIRKLGDEALRKVCRPVTEITPRTLCLLDDMLETMRKNDGVGLAAPQVGILRRMFVVEWEEKVYELINPEILETSGSVCEDEGCLSLPGFFGEVERPAYVKIAGLNRQGEKVIYEGTGMLAKAFCHENDHLDGIPYWTKAKNLRRVEE